MCDIYLKKEMSHIIDKIKNSRNNQNPSLAKEIRKNPEYEKELNDATFFLNEFLPEHNVTGIRMWYIRNEVMQILKCKNCNKPLNKIIEFCAGGCSSIYYNKNKTTEQIKNKAESISKRYNNKTDEEKEKIKANRKITFVERYNVEHNFLIPGAFQKIEEKNLLKYGFKSATKNNEVKNKIKQTNILRYGGNTPMSSPIIKRKVKETLFKNYGVESPNFLQYKEYIMPSGKIIKYQGYENKAFVLLLDKYNEDYFTPVKKEIFKETGKIIYTNKDGKISTYYPDILVKAEKKIIEVKSWFTFKINKENNMLKRQACIDLGFSFEFWVFKDNNELTII
jgi:protein-arginine kinase activator protein McsA